MLLNCLHVCPLVRAARYHRRLPRRCYDFDRNNIAESLIALFSHGLKRVIEFVFLNVDALLPCLLKLLKHLLRFIDAISIAFEFHPAFACRHFDAQRVLEILQKLDVIRVKRLQSAWTLKLQSPRFSHNQGVGRCQCAAGRRQSCQCTSSGNHTPAPNGCVPLAIVPRSQ